MYTGDTLRILESMYTGRKVLPKKINPSKDQVAQLQEIICKIVNIRPIDLISKSRKTEFVMARQFLSCSLKQIGDIMHRDHASVLHHIKTAKNYFNNEISYRYNYRNCIDLSREIFTRDMLMPELWNEKITDLNNFIDNLVITSNEYTRKEIADSLKESESFVSDIHKLMIRIVQRHNSLQKRERLIRKVEENIENNYAV